MYYWNKPMETIGREDLERIQLERLQRTVLRMYTNVPFYRERMQQQGVKPEDVQSLADLRLLPFMDKRDLRDNYPFGLFAVPTDRVVRIHASSGTTGKPTVVGYTKKDLDMWAGVMGRIICAAGVTEKDIAQISFGYGLFTGALGMHAAVERGMRQTEVLPGPFRIARRANALMQDVMQRTDDPLAVLDWVNVYAMAVAEENAAGGRVVTAPTNGAAGVIPAVIEYYLRHVSGSTMEGVRTFLLTAGAVGMLYKENASISGAEVGCQGEVGVACSMAASGLAAVCGGTVEQIENAAEIGMEHNLGLTCDPVAGQVQIPCIERNAIAAVKAINAARMALRGNGSHYISLDQVIRTMMATGRDMQSKYKETSLGGLALSIVEC